MSKKILHLMVLDKFIPPFIEFVNKNFNVDEHIYLILDKKHEKYGKLDAKNIEYITSKKEVFKLLRYVYKSKKIIIHGLWNEHFNQLLFLQPWLLKKCYWVMWGGDFYFPEKQSFIKKQVIKKMGHFITYIKGDYELVQKWYGANGKWHRCFLYPQGVYVDKKYNLGKKKNTTFIQIGNSATPTNNHFEIFEKLLPLKNENIQIYVPLSYGDLNYAKKVIERGKKLFGDKFNPLTKFIPFEKYIELLADIDIAIFAHNRQQALGNIIMLLGMGKKVYLRSDVTPFRTFNELGIKIFDFNKDISLKSLDEETKNRNNKIIKEVFSEKNLINQWENIFKDI